MMALSVRIRLQLNQRSTTSDYDIHPFIRFDIYIKCYHPLPDLGNKFIVLYPYL